MDEPTRILLKALLHIMDNAPDEEPEEESYDDTESAYNNGGEVAWWQAKQIAQVAVRNAGLESELQEERRRRDHPDSDA